jgi:Menin
MTNFFSVCRHSKEDEEIYKEFMEINNELIPHVLKTEGEKLT